LDRLRPPDKAAFSRGFHPPIVIQYLKHLPTAQATLGLSNIHVLRALSLISRTVTDHVVAKVRHNLFLVTYTKPSGE
jgi:hypothetical protein